MPIRPGRPKGGTTTSDNGAPTGSGCGGIDDLDAKRKSKMQPESDGTAELDDGDEED